MMRVSLEKGSDPVSILLLRAVIQRFLGRLALSASLVGPMVPRRLAAGVFNRIPKPAVHCGS